MSVFETDRLEHITEINLAWNDVLQTRCFPACTAEQGLGWGPEILQRRTS